MNLSKVIARSLEFRTENLGIRSEKFAYKTDSFLQELVVYGEKVAVY